MLVILLQSSCGTVYRFCVCLGAAAVPLFSWRVFHLSLQKQLNPIISLLKSRWQYFDSIMYLTCIWNTRNQVKEPIRGFFWGCSGGTATPYMRFCALLKFSASQCGWNKRLMDYAVTLGPDVHLLCTNIGLVGKSVIWQCCSHFQHNTHSQKTINGNHSPQIIYFQWEFGDLRHYEWQQLLEIWQNWAEFKMMWMHSVGLLFHFHLF